MPSVGFESFAPATYDSSHMAHDLRHRLLGAWARWVCRHPYQILILAALGVVLSLTLVLGYFPGVGRLGFQSNRNDLISPELPWNQRFIDWQDNFGGGTELVVVVDAGDKEGKVTPQRTVEVRKIVDDLGRQLSPRQSEFVEKADWGAFFSPRALRLAPLPRVKEELARLNDAATLLQSANLETMLRNIMARLRDSDNEETTEEEALAGINDLIALVGEIGQSITQPDHALNLDVDATPAPPEIKPDTPQAALGSWDYFSSDNGRLYFIRVKPRAKEGVLNAFADAIAGIRAIVGQTNAAHPDYDIGLTGIDVVEADETAAATWDGTWTSILAAILIATLLIIAFHSFRTPLWAMVALFVGVGWSFGFATLSVGYLQVISVIFTVMLLGLGVAYGIYLASRYELVRPEYDEGVPGFERAIGDTIQTMGPGIITGAVTTAVAFVTTMFTDFKGVGEMGLIAAGGVMLCLLAMLGVFPALLRLYKHDRHHVALMGDRWFHFYEERWSLPFARHPWLTLLTAAIVTTASLAAISVMRFDYDLLKLQPKGVDSVEWAQRIVRDGGESIWSGVSLIEAKDDADLTRQVRQRKEAFLQLPTVSAVRGIGFLEPEENDAKVALMREYGAKLDPLAKRVLAEQTPPANLNPVPDVVSAMGDLRGMVTLAMLFRKGQMPPAIRDAMSRLGDELDGVLTEVKKVSEATRQERLRVMQDQYRAFRQTAARRIELTLDTRPLQITDLPPALMENYISVTKDGQRRYVMEIYPKLPNDPASEIDGPLHPHFLPRFVSDLRQVDPLITGVIVQIYESGDLIWRSYLWAGIYAFVAVFLLLLLDFRNPYDAGLCLVPVVIGFAVTFGVMWVFGMKLNPANIIVLPLMFGIGVDSGVHMLHRYRMDATTRPLGLTAGTGKGITVTSLTTMIGFGALGLASHRGIESLGLTMTAGIGLTMLACLTVMPAWLELRQRRIEKKRA